MKGLATICSKNISMTTVQRSVKRLLTLEVRETITSSIRKANARPNVLVQIVPKEACEYENLQE